jgi:hypothetical protein
VPGPLVGEGEVQVAVFSQGHEVRVVKAADAAPVCSVLGQRVLELVDGCVGAAEAGDPAPL